MARLAKAYVSFCCNLAIEGLEGGLTSYFVSRHEGAHAWFQAMVAERRVAAGPVEFLKHFDLAVARAGDTVLGTLPMPMAAAIRAKGARFVNLDLDVPQELRGLDLTEAQMRRCGATLTEYAVDRVRSAVLQKRAEAPDGGPVSSLTVMLASAEAAPQLIGWLHRRTDRVAVVATPAMQSAAQRICSILARWLEPDRITIEGATHPTRHEWANWAENWLAQLAHDGRQEVRVNCTGGTKQMSLAFDDAGSRCARRGLPVSAYYVDTEGKQIDDFADEPNPLRSCLDLGLLLECRGLSVHGSYSATDAYARDGQRIRTVRCLFDLPHKLVGEFNHIMSSWEQQDVPPQILEASPTQKLRDRLLADLGQALVDEDCFEEIAEKHPGGPLILTMRASDAAVRKQDLRFLSGGWLERWVGAQILEAGTDDFGVSVGITDANGVTNDIDAAVVCGNRLLVMEIKTANQARRNADGPVAGFGNGQRNRVAENTLYKAASVGNRIAPLFAEGWLVSLRKLDGADLRRAESLRVKVFMVGTDAGRQAFRTALNQWIGRVRLDRCAGIEAVLAAPTRV